MFIDEVEIKVISWKGWDGIVSWRREKYIPKWWPWWWNGWNGWNVYIKTNNNINTLSEYRHKKVLKAQSWESWKTNTKSGADASDLILSVPVWTVIRDSNTNDLIADLNLNNSKILVAKGGRWWYGNAHFCSSTRQAPWFAELWDVSEERDLKLELKLVADIWIIWIPSAWKSTLIWNITNIKPKIWDYPFTTITPNLWVLEHKWKSLVLEDVPGLIPGASKGKGLWIKFLKHIERTNVLLHLLDLSRLDNIFEDYKNIRYELECFSKDFKYDNDSKKLDEKEEIIVFTKWDLLDEEMKKFILEQFKSKYKSKKVFVISSATKEWITDLKDFLIDSYSSSNLKKEKSENLDYTDEVELFDLKYRVEDKKPRISYLWDMKFKASWERLEQIVRMTDFSNDEAVMRIYDVMDKMGLMKEIEKKFKDILRDENAYNDFFFESKDEKKDFSPSIEIAWRDISLDKLIYL